MEIIDDFDFDRIIQIVTTISGIIPRDSHLTGIRNFLEKRLAELKISAPDYYNLLISSEGERELLINSATVNETYFFREEPQFDFLRTKVFPEYKASSLLPVKIWSAAASSGEEIYSLYLLAASMGLKTRCTASDINSSVLQKCREGKYSKRSLRAGDGASFESMLLPYKKTDGSIEFPPEICSQIECHKINLSKTQDFPKGQDIIFLRNVFIYFDMDTKRRILAEITQNSLAEGGWLFVSMNETASIDASIMPRDLVKFSDGKVFYFRKITEKR